MMTKFYSSMRVSFFATFLMIAISSQVSAQQFLTKIDGWNAYVHLPDDYNDSLSKKYPLICFVSGLGEIGTDPNKMLIYGPSKFIAEGHKMEFTVNGKLEKPIVISIQPAAAWPAAYWMNRKIDSIMARYRCDAQRINVTGLSMGGWAWANMVDNYNAEYTNKITSMVVMSALQPDNGIGNMKHYSLAGGTMWAFEGNNDLRGYDKVRDTMNRAVSSSARYTLYTGGHCCWNNFYTPNYMENGENIYTWMLKQKKILVQNPGPGSPEANAGSDSATQNIIATLPLKGNGNDPNGLPINFSWRKISGPTGGNIANSGLMQTSVSGLIQGVYRYELKVTNSLGLIGTDTVTINNATATVLPVIVESFSGKLASNNSVSLYWKTSNEINASYFIVERSTDDHNYVPIAKVFAAGVNGNGATYNSLDKLPALGNNYYRLKMVDIDESFEYSRIILVKTNDKNNHTIAITSAYSDQARLQLNINSNESKPAKLSVLDANGRIIYSSNLALRNGMNLFIENMTLPRGVYHIIVTTDGERVSKSVIR